MERMRPPAHPRDSPPSPLTRYLCTGVLKRMLGHREESGVPNRSELEPITGLAERDGWVAELLRRGMPHDSVLNCVGGDTEVRSLPHHTSFLNQ